MSGHKPKAGALAAVLLLAAILIIPNGALAAPYTDLPAVSGAMLQADYWISRINDPDRILMDPGQIRVFNQETWKQSADSTMAVYDLSEYPAQLSREQLSSWIALDPGEGPYYMAGESSPLDRAILDQAVANMGLDSLNQSNPVGYGVAVERCNMKCLPIAEAISDEPDDLEYDAFQYTVALPGEPLRILHESQDREWQFVQGYNCRGWIESRFLAQASHEQWLDYVQARDQRFIMVAANRVVLNENPHDEGISQLALPMATRLPLTSEDAIPALVDGQNPSGNWVVDMPVRDSAGKLSSKMVLIPGSADVRESFLPYTSANIIRQVFKTMGDRYGWGGMLNGRDCSALVMDLYGCFGFTMGRNTSEQSRLRVGAVLDLEGYSEAYRSQLMGSLRPGAALYFPGHTMIYLGEDSGRHYVISALGSYALPGQNGTMDIQRVHGTVINDLSLKRRNGNTWLKELTNAQQNFNFHFDDLDGLSGQTAVEKLADQFVVSGNSSREFLPQGSLSRGELAQLLMRSMKLEPAPEAAPFTDTKEHWSRGAVGAMVKSGLMNGAYAEYFLPEALVTRAELAAIMARCPENSLPPFDPTLAPTICSDFAAVPGWAQSGVYQCLSVQALVNREDGRFAPQETATRLEAAAAIYGALY